MKKLISIALCLCLAFALCACGDKETPADTEFKPEDVGGSTQIANPFTECDTLEEACELGGFDMTVPEMLDGFDTRAFLVEEGNSITAVYNSEDSYIKITKYASKDFENGDYNDYDQMKTVDCGDICPLIKGSDGLYSAAEWDDGINGFYLISEIGLSEEVITDLINSVK